VRVMDAGGAAPTVPFWLGEAPARTKSSPKRWGAARRAGALPGATRCGGRTCGGHGPGGSQRRCRDQVVAYSAGHAALGALPTRDTSWSSGSSTRPKHPARRARPFGGRINRALGLALRKRFCVSFDFELQASADDDTVAIALGPHHSFPLPQVPKMLRSATVVDVLTQAVLPHPMLATRWRWNCNRALIVPRSRAPAPSDPPPAHGR